MADVNMISLQILLFSVLIAQQQRRPLFLVNQIRNTIYDY